MAKNGAKGGGRIDEVARRSQVTKPKTGEWTRRSPSSGRFRTMKEKGGDFKGVPRER